MEKKLKILHLEDVAFDAEMVERELKKSGLQFEKKVVDNRDDFEAALQTFCPDLILSDHCLPAFDSTGAIRLVKEKAPCTPLILVTATVSEEFAVNILQQGAADYVLKTNLKRLPSAVINTIEKARAIREKLVAEAELKKSHSQLRSLASHLQHVREEERSAIAREVHDELGQQLTAIKLDISWLMLKLADAGEDIVAKTTEIEKLVTDALKTVKRIVTELHPAILEKLGIVEAIRWQGHEFEKRSGIKVKPSLTEEEVVLSAKAGIALFRVFQESLTNIAKHADAKNISVSLQKWNDELFLTIIDDGKGFDTTAKKENESLGLLSMKERSLMIGGKYEISSEPGRGTRVLIVAPLDDKSTYN